MNTPKLLFIGIIVQLTLVASVSSQSNDNIEFDSTLDSILNVASMRRSLLDESIFDSLSCREQLILSMNKTVYDNTIQRLKLLKIISSSFSELGIESRAFVEWLERFGKSMAENIPGIVSYSTYMDEASSDHVTNEIMDKLVMPSIIYLAIDREKLRIDLKNELHDSLCNVLQVVVRQIRTGGEILQENVEMMSGQNMQRNYLSTAADIESIARTLEKLIQQGDSTCVIKE